jgi:hypothetical protein
MSLSWPPSPRICDGSHRWPRDRRPLRLCALRNVGVAWSASGPPDQCRPVLNERTTVHRQQPTFATKSARSGHSRRGRRGHRAAADLGRRGRSDDGNVEHLSRSNQGTALFRRNCLSSDPTPKANPASSSTSRSAQSSGRREIERHRMPISVGRSRGLRTCASCSRPAAR